MIYPETKILISDNSGAKVAKCIKVMNSSRHRGSKPSDLAVISLRKVKSNKKLRKGEIHRGVIIRCKKNFQRSSGVSIKFGDNAIVLVNEKNLPLSSRIFGPIYKELYYKNFSKVLSLAKTIV